MKRTSETKRRDVLNYLMSHDRLSLIEAQGKVKRLCQGPELEAYHMLAMQWREQGSKHVLKPEVFKQVLDFNGSTPENPSR